MTILSLRRFAAAGLIAAGLAGPAWAQWPDRPIKLISPFPPGGQVGTLAYTIAQKLGPLVGQPVVMEPRPGAAGSIAASFVAKAPKDGYTLLFGTSSMLGVAKFTYANLPYDPVADFSPVAYVGNVTVGVFASLQSGITTVEQMIAQAKANPGKLNFGSPGIGSASHLAGELFQQQAGVRLMHVPYPSNTAQMTDLVNGQTQLSFSGAASGHLYSKDGRTRFVAVAAPRRVPQYPDVPALGEFLPGYDAPAWLGIVAPAGTPSDIVNRLHEGISKVLANPELVPLFDAQALDRGDPMSPAAFGDKIQREMALWEKAVRASGMQVEGRK